MTARPPGTFAAAWLVARKDLTIEFRTRTASAESAGSDCADAVTMRSRRLSCAGGFSGRELNRPIFVPQNAVAAITISVMVAITNDKRRGIDDGRTNGATPASPTVSSKTAVTGWVCKAAPFAALLV